MHGTGDFSPLHESSLCSFAKILTKWGREGADLFGVGVFT